MGVIGIEEKFLKVRDMAKALDFYHGILGLPIDKRDDKPIGTACMSWEDFSDNDGCQRVNVW